MRAFVAALCLTAAASAGAALDNLAAVSETVSHFEKVFGVRGRVTGWFVTGDASTLNFTFSSRGKISFRLAEPAAGSRHVNLIQVEPEKEVLTAAQAEGYALFLVEALSRSSNVACAPLRNDRDGINAFSTYSCAEKNAPPTRPPTELTVTVQSVGGRRLIFAQFVSKTR